MNSFEKIKIIRQLSKLTQTEFGESMGLSKATISNFETGRVPIPTYVAILLKLLYNIDPEWLMDDEQEDLSKRFFNKQEPDDANLVSSITEKSKKLNTSYKKYLLRSIANLIALQENEKTGTCEK